MTDEVLDCFAVSAPGLEAVTAHELEALGLAPGPLEPGGVPFRTDRTGLRRANLWSRTASRILVRIASFRARTFFELERHAARVDWARVACAGGPSFQVTSRKSRLYHEDAIAERLHRAAGPQLDEGSSGRIVVRVVRDRFTISADSSGERLHRRGWRTALARAPMRETLAAAMLQAVDWTAGEALVDPFCGAGTIPIEAALLARNIAPGLGRRFAFEEWPGHEPEAWASEREAARAEAEPGVTVLRASDRDAGAIESAMANAERAGVGSDIRFEVAPLSAAAAFREVPAPALLLTNPPYGVRVGEVAGLRDLYAALGALVRGRAGWRAAWLDASPQLAAATGLETRPVLETSNGGIPVTLLATAPE